MLLKILLVICVCHIPHPVQLDFGSNHPLKPTRVVWWGMRNVSLSRIIEENYRECILTTSLPPRWLRFSKPWRDSCIFINYDTKQAGLLSTITMCMILNEVGFKLRNSHVSKKGPSVLILWGGLKGYFRHWRAKPNDHHRDKRRWYPSSWRGLEVVGLGLAWAWDPEEDYYQTKPNQTSPGVPCFCR